MFGILYINTISHGWPINKIITSYTLWRLYSQVASGSVGVNLHIYYTLTLNLIGLHPLLE